MTRRSLLSFHAFDSHGFLPFHSSLHVRKLPGLRADARKNRRPWQRQIEVTNVIKNLNMLEKGTKAPDFTGFDENGRQVSLSDFAGKKLVLYFYPKDSTPGCTAEACNLRDNYERFLSGGYEILGVSKDSQASHRKFIEKYSLPFHLISDTDCTILKAYEAWGPKKFMGKETIGTLRTTYVIDGDGTIIESIGKVDTKNHSDQLL